MKVSSLIVGLAVAFGCAQTSPAEVPATQPSQRFQIVTGTVSADYGKGLSRTATNTILIDTNTGETWILWPDQESGSYSWFKISRKEGALPAGGPATKPGWE